MRPRRDHILALVAAEYSLPIAYVAGPMRWKAYVEARATFIHAARAFGYTLNQIGEVINRDHATVQHSLKKDPGKLRNLPSVMSRLTQKVAA